MSLKNGSHAKGCWKYFWMASKVYNIFRTRQLLSGIVVQYSYGTNWIEDPLFFVVRQNYVYRAKSHNRVNFFVVLNRLAIPKVDFIFALTQVLFLRVGLI